MRKTLVYTQPDSKNHSRAAVMAGAVMLLMASVVGSYWMVKNQPQTPPQSTPEMRDKANGLSPGSDSDCIGVWASAGDGYQELSGFILWIKADHTFQSWGARPVRGLELKIRDELDAPSSTRLPYPPGGPSAWVVTSGGGYWAWKLTDVPDPSEKGRTFSEYRMTFYSPIEPGSPSSQSQVYRVSTARHMHVGKELRLTSVDFTYGFNQCGLSGADGPWLAAVKNKFPDTLRFSSSNFSGS